MSRVIKERAGKDQLNQKLYLVNLVKSPFSLLGQNGISST